MRLKLIEWNGRICRAFTPSHQRQFNTFSMFYKLAGLLFAMPDTRRVLDVGAGRRWAFPLAYKEAFDLQLIGMDISSREMAFNVALDRQIEADACGTWEIEQESVDLVTSFSGIEHFHDNATFLRNAARALRAGGALIAHFPNATAPFSLLNRMLPQSFKRRMLHLLHPADDDIIGFKAYYDKTTFKEFVRTAEDAGFEVDYYAPGYFWAGYGAFFFPLYIVIMVYNYLTFASGMKSLAGYHLFVLRRPGAHREIKYG